MVGSGSMFLVSTEIFCRFLALPEEKKKLKDEGAKKNKNRFFSLRHFLHTRHTRRTKTHYKNKNGSATVELFTGRG